MLCVNACINNTAETFIQTNSENIKSSGDLKILGFRFDSRPNANKHVEELIERFHQKLWTLRFLKRSGIKADDLLALYYCSVRSAVEYCSVIYHSLIPTTLATKLETIQRQALRIIYGWNCNLEEIMAAKNIETLETRREKAVLSFALKNEHVGKYGKRWFKEEEGVSYDLRNQRYKYKIPKGRTN